jgi:hypothetical protein
VFAADINLMIDNCKAYNDSDAVEYGTQILIGSLACAINRDVPRLDCTDSIVASILWNRCCIGRNKPLAPIHVRFSAIELCL